MNPPVQANSKWPKTETIISGERVVTGKIFQALPTQTDTTIVAFIYKICITLFSELGELLKPVYTFSCVSLKIE